VRLATHLLGEEAEYWWANSKRRLEAGGVVVSWERFKEEFLRKYFPADLRNKKEVEFLQLKERSKSVAEYVAKFDELSRFCPYINVEDVMVSKCVKFMSGLRPEIYQHVCFHEIGDFDTFVNKCQMFDEAWNDKVNYYKAVNDKKGKGHDHGSLMSRIKEGRGMLVVAPSRM